MKNIKTKKKDREVLERSMKIINHRNSRFVCKDTQFDPARSESWIDSIINSN